MVAGTSALHVQMNAVRTRRKMAVVSGVNLPLLLLLLLCCRLIALSEGACDQYVATNGNFTVPVGRTSALLSSESLKWIYGRNTILHIRQKLFIRGRKEDIDEKGSLKLTNVNENQSGKYTPELWGSTGKAVGNLNSTYLCVLDPVQKPDAKAECYEAIVKFTCRVGQQAKNVTIEWLQNDKVMANQNGRTLTQTVAQAGAQKFSCNVSNPVSWRTSAAVEQKCQPRNFVFPILLGIDSRIFVGIGGGVVLLLIVGVIVCCLMTRRKKRRHLKEEDELRLAWTNSNQQQRHHPPNQSHRCHQQQQQQQQQAPGHTGPRQHHSKHHHDYRRPKAPEPSSAPPQAGPRRPAQGPRPDDVSDEQPPPLPQPRKKAPTIPRA